MPRSRESHEHQILKWFQSAPLTVATVVFGLVAGVMKDRKPAAARTRKAAPIVDEPGFHTSVNPDFEKESRKKPKRKRKPRAAVAAAEVDDLSLHTQ